MNLARRFSRVGPRYLALGEPWPDLRESLLVFDHEQQPECLQDRTERAQAQPVSQNSGTPTIFQRASRVPPLIEGDAEEVTNGVAGIGANTADDTGQSWLG